MKPLRNAQEMGPGREPGRGRRLDDAEMHRLMAGARPEPARLPDDAARRVLANVMAQMPPPTPARPKRAPFKALSFAGAGLAAGCLAVSAVALWQNGESAMAPPPSAPPPTAVAEVAAPPAAPTAVAAVKAGPRKPASRPSPFTTAPPRQHRSKPTTRIAQAPPTPTPAPATSEHGVDAQLSQILVVTSTQVKPRVTVTTEPVDGGSYARVAMYSPDAQGDGAASECVIVTSPTGEQSVRLAAQADSATADAPYLSVETVPNAAPDAEAADAASTDVIADVPAPEAPETVSPEPAVDLPTAPVEPGTETLRGTDQ